MPPPSERGKSESAWPSGLPRSTPRGWLPVRQRGATAIGLALGIAAALIVGRYISSLLFGVGSADPVTLLVACGLFAGAAAAASYIPARCAAAVDPSVAVRSEWPR